MSSKNVFLPSKPRYEILDGLRGVAALLILIFHIFEDESTRGPAFQHLNHGYLAVEFFFLLSGFVIGYAYDDRWDKMTVGGFFKRRLVRLHPMAGWRRPGRWQHRRKARFPSGGYGSRS